MYNVSQLPTIIEIGYTGEEKFRKVEIDMSDWMQQMPDGVASIVHIRPGETAEDAYIAETATEGNILTWEITQNDLGTKEGTGLMQVWLEETQNTTLQKRGKSVVVSTLVREAINDPGDTVPPARTALLNLTAEAEGLPAGSDPTAELEHDGYYGDYTLKLGIPKGDKGDKGDQGDPAPAATVTTAVDAYLAANFSNPSNPPLDRTLSSSSSATPADITGDLKSAITPILITHPSTDYYFRLGGLVSTGEVNDENTKRVRTNLRYFARKGSTITAKTGWQFNIALYATDEIYSFISGSYVSFSANQYKFAEDSYFMVSIKNTDERTFTTDTIIDAVNGIEFNIIGVNWLPPCVTHDFSRILPPSMPDVLHAKLDNVHWNPNALNWQQGDPATPIFKGAHDRVIEKYDELMNDWCPPDYTIFKTRLGSDASGTIYLWRYDFYPSVPVTNNAIVNDSYHTYSSDDYPVVIMDSGIHGNEKPSVYALLNLMYEIVTAKGNDIFGWLHNHIHFVIVPFVNPYGFEYDTRYNYNHVDLNRNFLAYWGWNSTSAETDPTSANYRGASANSEAETKLITAILKEYQNKAVLYYSWHTHGVFTAYNTMTCYALPQSTLYDKMQNIGYQLISSITNSAHTNHEVSTDSGYIGELETESYKGYTAYTGLYYGIPSAVPECMHRIYDGQSGTKLTDNNANCLNVEYMLYSVGLALKSLLY